MRVIVVMLLIDQRKRDRILGLYAAEYMALLGGSDVLLQNFICQGYHRVVPFAGFGNARIK